MNSNSQSTKNFCSVCQSNICEIEATLAEEIISVVHKSYQKYSEELKDHPLSGNTNKLYQRIGRKEAASEISRQIGSVISEHVRKTLDRLNQSLP